MTRHESFAVTEISDKEMVLATDLDGTFLGGTEQDRKDFYAWIENNRHRVGLIFVTGRDPGFIRETVRAGVPKPDYVIGDVGTTIAEFDHDGFVAPIAELEAEIAKAWGNANAKVENALMKIKGLARQSSAFRYRVSYDLDAKEFDQEALDIVAQLGLDALVSDNRFFDVLPKGVSKGPSLLRLLASLGIENSRTLVAGDTLNDLSMLELGLPSVAVGGSEPGLVEKLQGQQHVHCATGVGVSGIAEAILKHGLLTQA
ncbi:HAD-IIB family hydrolase [Yoonia sediminilitoris]|uniref:HAD superfamily hydrolase (TIGR01484 family) n=1 Tax=Yoonia sediminilitoris TaxID=1286148 RepID=A0A2T6KMY3_9RHOB|nr:HAD-IIB family hydrolase [Yoonia sediminilitoris]PUB17524.1 HAD superfamily hydrolase (TIGR01484 family) [Yoonia sediminilitoris]RCW97819.1 HAD superfamily hydrolase (TIGR01484 family) [Yoonia sediminilitoris]